MRVVILTAVTAAVVVGLAVPILWPAPAGRAPVMTLCRDGARSFSKHRSGTCSWHSGIAAFAGEAPRPMAEERGDAVVNDAAQAERRACQAMPSDEPWPGCAAR